VLRYQYFIKGLIIQEVSGCLEAVHVPNDFGLNINLLWNNESVYEIKISISETANFTKSIRIKSL
jgi:hypothetical protein